MQVGLEDGTNGIVLSQQHSPTVTLQGNSVVQVYSAEHIQDMIETHPEVAERCYSLWHRDCLMP